MLAGVKLSGSALSFVIGSHAAITLVGGLVRAFIFEGRLPHDPVPRLGVKAASALSCGLIASLSILMLVLDRSWLDLATGLAAGFAYVVSESRRSAVHARRDFERAIVGAAVWVSVSAAALAAGIVMDVTWSPYLLFAAWGVGAGATILAYGKSDRVGVVDRTGWASGGEFALGTGSEQVAFYVGGATASSVTLAAVRLLASMLAPVNIAAFAVRTLRLSGSEQQASRRPSATASLVLLGLAVAVSAFLETRGEYELWQALLAAAPVAIAARALAAALYAWSADGRHERGIWRTGLLRSIPGLALGAAFVVPGSTPTVAYAALGLGAWLALRAMSLFGAQNPVPAVR